MKALGRQQSEQPGTRINPLAEHSQTAHREEWKILAVTCLGAFLFFNSFGSISVALPTIQIQFGNSLAEIQWISLIGVVMISSLSFCFGKAGDLLGQRRLYKIGVILYALGAGLAAFSNSFLQLLASRGVMSIGLAMALPMSAAILASTFSPERRGQALGLFASAIAIGRATGPTLGGLLLYLWGWEAIFLMNCLIGIGVSCAVLKIFKGNGERRQEPFDFWGSLSLMIGYPALLIALTIGANSGWNSAQIPLWVALAAVGLGSFVWIELRSQYPLIDLYLFKRRSLSTALSSLALSHVLYNPISLCGPLFMQNALGASPLTVGLVLAVLPLSTAISSPWSGRLADRFEARRIATLGLGLLFVGIFFYSRLGVSSNYFLVCVALALMGLGTGFFIPANQKAAFSSVRSGDYGILSAMLSSFGTAAGTLGITVTVALMASMMSARGFQNPGEFAGAQQFAFTSLLPLGAIAIWVSWSGKSKESE